MNFSYSLFVIAIILLLSGCSKKNLVSLDARDDTRKYEQAKKFQTNFPIQVCAHGETEAMPNKIADDSADDPAIWIDEENPANSVFFGSNKKKGIYAYDLAGKLVQELLCGKINNIDVKTIEFKGEKRIIVSGSNRTTNTLDFYFWNNELRKLSSLKASFQSNVEIVYGYCLHVDSKGQLFAFVNTKTGEIEQWEIDVLSDKSLSGELIRSFRLGSQVEGMVVDDEDEVLYVGEENAGIYYFDLAERPIPQAHKINNTSMEENPNICYDIEGIDIFKYNDKKYLIASSQGNFSYALYDITKKSKYLGSFVITDCDRIDGAEETDGLEVASFPINDNYPEGIIVVQDGFNKNETTDLPQNFKYVSLKEVMDRLLK